jgi:hypothetical protein
VVCVGTHGESHCWSELKAIQQPVRMLRGPEVDFGGAPLFWLELFDHGRKTSVDGRSCRRIKDAVPIFDDLISQADRLNKNR